MTEGIPRRQKDLKTLVELAAMISSSLDIQTVLDNAMTSVQMSMNAEASAIFELDRAKGELFFRTALGDAAEKAKEVRLKIGEGIAGWVAQTGQPLIVENALDDPRFWPVVDVKTGFVTRSILCVPMIYKGQLVGALEVLNKKDGRVFDGNDMEMLTIIANQVTIAIQNAKLYSTLNEKFCIATEDLKITQEKLIRTERLAALGKLSQGVAHEVRNPVMVIGGFARRLQAQFPDGDPMRDTVEIILAQTERLERMVTDIEAFSRLRRPVLRLLSISRVIEESLRKLSDRLESQAIRVIERFSKETPDIAADEELLGLALGNVLLNAIEAMPAGGILELGLSTYANGLLISVKDSGVGIQHENLPSVFDPFFTSKTTGSGLGLATVHRIISDHSGEIEIDSIPTQGTEVRIRLPYLQAEAGGMEIKSALQPVKDLHFAEPNSKADINSE
jgi:signal transduction histidine kinase